MADIFQMRLGTSMVYLVRGEMGCILVDAGNKGQAAKFISRLKDFGLSTADIELILITHVHFDHVGSLYEIKEMCNCPVAVHLNEAKLLEEGKIVIPPGTNFFTKGVSWLAGRLFAGRNKMKPVIPEITFKEELSLEDFGVKGKVIHTPGHTSGSVSVLLPKGEAIVGDLAINYLPFGLGPIYPPFAGNWQDLLQSWQKLINAKVRTLYPGHGQPFNISQLKSKLIAKSNSLPEKGTIS